MKLLSGYRIINRKKLFITALADLIGNILFLPLRLFRKNEPIRPDNIKEILVIRTAYIGDVVMTLPLLKPLKERFKEARVTFLTSSKAKAVLENNPCIDEIVTYDPFWFYPTAKGEYLTFIKGLKKRSFDMVIEARGDIREFLFLLMPLKSKYKVSYDVGGGGFFLTDVVPYKGRNHRVEYHLDIARYLGCDEGSEVEWGIYLKDDEKERVLSILEENGVSGGDSFISIHPGARKELKCWSKEGYAALADAIMDEFALPVVLTGAPDETQLVEGVAKLMKNRAVNLAGSTSLRELSGIIGNSSLFICNDSSPMHIAAAMKTPAVAIFGPSKSKETGPYGDGYLVVEKDFDCRDNCDEDVCLHKDYNQCMKDISVDDVMAAVRDKLSFIKGKKNATLH